MACKILGTLSHRSSTEASAINDLAQITGQSPTAVPPIQPSAGPHAFRWTS